MNSNTENSDDNEILARLAHLERQNRRIKLACAGTVAIVVVAVTVSATWVNGHQHASAQVIATSRPSARDISATALPAANEVRANRFVLTDHAGKMLAELAVLKNGPGLVLYDGKETPRVVLRTTNWGPSLILCGDEHGIRLQALDDREVKSGVFDRGFTTGASLSTSGLGAFLVFSGEKGQSLAQLAAFMGNASLSLGEWYTPATTGGPLVRLSTSKEDGASLGLRDEAGRTRINLGSTTDGPNLSLADEAGKFRAVLGCTSTENPMDGTVMKWPESSLLLFDKDGKVSWGTP
jgi:hypothetical protein